MFALSNLPTLTGPDASHLLVLSQEAGRIVNVDRAGAVSSALTIVSDPGNPLSVADQSHEGVAMDDDGRLYVASEGGGGDADHPQLWVYAPSTAPNRAPTAVALTDQVQSVAENTSTATRLKVADVAIADDGLGTNNLTLSGPDAGFFEVDASGLYIKAGTVLDYETKRSYSVTVAVDDPSVGSTPDATSAPFTLALTDVANEGSSPAPLVITEVSPWSSGNSPYSADWFELTNVGTQTVGLTGWKMDDNSNSFANAVALTGVTAIAPGQSAVFIEGNAAAAFKTAWFGAAVPAGFAIGSYSGSGVGLSTDGDAVNVFDAAGNRITGVGFGASTTYFTFDNAARLGSATLPLPVVSTLSVAGRNGAFLAGLATGSPGTVSPHQDATVAGAVPATLSLSLGAPASFGTFTPGLAHDYTAATTASVISTAGGATLSVSDPGHLTNGAFSLPEALQVDIAPAAWTGPVSNAAVAIAFHQHIGATDALRTGSYSRTLTFTLSTTTP